MAKPETSMSLSTRIAPHLTYLRRYSRAITGSQTSGDAYVRALLEMLIADISIFPQSSSDRIAVFKLYAASFGDLQVAIDPSPSAFSWEQRAARNLSQVSSRARQAFLLTALEGFGPAEIAEILEVNQTQATDLLRQASEEISRQVATDILIIEDEPLIAMDIEQMVESLGHKVVGIARTHKEAVSLYGKTMPKMILADIQLADGSSGLDAVREILGQYEVPVIFVTSFPERLLTGERPEPTFLITKPYDPNSVKATISQALFFRTAASLAA